jgi:hypothetical protein
MKLASIIIVPKISETAGGIEKNACGFPLGHPFSPF